MDWRIILCSAISRYTGLTRKREIEITRIIAGYHGRPIPDYVQGLLIGYGLANPELQAIIERLLTVSSLKLSWQDIMKGENDA